MKYTNRIFWTSGVDSGCPFNFRWCSTNTTFTNASINWLSGQPNNLNGIQDCVQFMLTTGLWTSSAFNDESCAYANYYICEAERNVLQSIAYQSTTTVTTTTVTTTTPPPAVMMTTCQPSCPTFTCDKDVSFFEERSGLSRIGLIPCHSIENKIEY